MSRREFMAHGREWGEQEREKRKRVGMEKGNFQFEDSHLSRFISVSRKCRVQESGAGNELDSEFCNLNFALGCISDFRGIP